MKGRVYDPKLGRFLTTDPIVTNIGFGQAFNPYSYVLNNPLAYTDPSGWRGEPEKHRLEPEDPPTPREPKQQPKPQEKSPNGTTGTQPKPPDTKPTGAQPPPATPPPPTAAPPPAPPDPPPPPPPPPKENEKEESWVQNPLVQTIGGFFAGVGIGIVPFAGAGEQILEGGGVIPEGSPEAETGLAVGQIVGGIFTMVGGVGGEVLGGVATATGIGAVVGVPAIAVSTTVVVGGAANVAAGLRGLTQSMSSGSGSGPKGGTYKLRDRDTGQVRRTGRTNDLERRQNEHRRDPKTHDLDFDVDKKTDSYPAQRGREQRIYDEHPEADMNQRRPIDPKNPNREHYLQEGDKL